MVATFKSPHDNKRESQCEAEVEIYTNGGEAVEGLGGEHGALVGR